MKKLLLVFLSVLFLASCKKESIDPYKGEWKLVNTKVYNRICNFPYPTCYTSNIDYEYNILNYNVLDIDFLNDYDTLKNINKEYLYELRLNIDDKVLVRAKLKEKDFVVSKDTLYTVSYKKYDISETNYRISIDFGNNDFFISRYLYAEETEMTEDILILKYKEGTNTLISFESEYIFQRL